MREEKQVDMTDGDIIRDLNCCDNNDVSLCKMCTHRNYGNSCCIQLMKDALKLINRQKAEIETLRVIQEDLMSKLSEAIKHIELMKSVEKLDKISKW